MNGGASDVRQSPPRGRRAVEFAESLAGRAIIASALSYFSARLEGGENVPRSGGALLVANHGLNGYDGLVLGALLKRDVGRLPFWLGERNLWRIPLLGRLLDFVDAVPGEPFAAAEILRSGEIVVVYPGGVNDSFKLSTERHRLKWGARSGFARVAMLAGVPIVPVAAIGVDDMYTVVGREPFLGRTLLGHARYDLPLALGRWGTLLPNPAQVTIRALPPIQAHGDPSSPADVERVRAAVFDAVQNELSRHP